MRVRRSLLAGMLGCALVVATAGPLAADEGGRGRSCARASERIVRLHKEQDRVATRLQRASSQVGGVASRRVSRLERHAERAARELSGLQSRCGS